MVNQTQDSTGKTNTANDQNRKIFLGGLSYYTTDATLRAYCERFGQFTDCLVMRNPEGKSRGFGFVTYDDEQSVEQFMQSRPHNIDNRQIDPKRAMPREDQNSTEAHLSVKKLFVAGLRDGIDENALREYFTRFGNVTEVLVMKDRDGKHRGFAFVSFDDYDAVDKAILGKPHMINGRPLDIKKAIPKDKMQDMSRPPPSSNRYSMPPPSHRNNSYDQDPYPPPWGHPNGGHDGPPPPSYSSQGYNSSMNYNPYPSSYPSSMNPNVPPSSTMSYDGYATNPNNSNGNNNSSMSYNSNPANNYMASMPSSSYGANQSSTYGQMNMPYAPSGSAPPPPPPSGYNDGTSSAGASNSYGNNNNNNNYGMMSQSYSGDYSQMPSGPSRGGGAMRGSRGGYAGNSFNSRPAPYPNRGGGRGGGRGRGRGQ